jgi:hypothetical protein
MTNTIALAEDRVEKSGYRFSWGLVLAGGIAATAITFFLLSLGSGFGLLLVNPQTHSGPSLPTFLTGGAIFFIAAQRRFCASSQMVRLTRQLQAAFCRTFRSRSGLISLAALWQLL